MAAVTLNLKGGDKFKEHLQALARSLNKARAVRVGFLEGKDYPEGDGGARLADAAKRVTPAIAAAHPDWKPRLSAWAAWQATHSPRLSVAQVALWDEFGTVTSKPRPFFRSAIAKHSGEWGPLLGRFLKSSGYDSEVALSKLGVTISEQITESILSWPADNAELTAHIKQFNKGLVDSAVLSQSVSYEVRHG
jgi:hypothetical protein